jgi:nucleoside-diphosphate-sugar epimerase
MKILILGGTGNISRWFVPSLITKGHDVTLFNRGVRKVEFPGTHKTIIGDRTDYAAFENQMHEAGKFDCVIDMVGFEPEEARSAVRAFRGRVGQYIFCSTVDVFTKKPLAYPIREDGEINASQTFPYAYKKVQMEKILQDASSKDNFPLTIIRPAATYSEGWSPLVTCFGGASYHLDRLIKGKPVILHGDGNAIWVASHSEDVGRAFVGAIGNSKTIGKAYNVSGDELMTWHAMHRIVAEELKAPEPDFVHIPTSVLSKLAPNDSEWCVENFQFNNIFDNTLAKQDLGFQYTVSYREGAKRCIRYLQDNNLIEDSSNHPFYDEIIRRWNTILDKI